VDYWRREMPDRVAEGLYDTRDRVFVEPHAPHRPCGIPVRRLYIDPCERRRCRAYIPTALVEGTSVHARRRMRVREDHPETNAASHQARLPMRGGLRTRCRPDQRPHAGRVCHLGASRWRRSVTCPARQCSVNGVTRNVLLLRSSNRALEAQEPLRQYILDAYSRLEDRA
jgi:hypothetical protein